MRLRERIREPLGVFVGIWKTLGEDSWGFTRIHETLEEYSQGFARLWERIRTILGEDS